MKSFTITLVVASISIICILSIGLVSALNQEEASVSLSWSSQTYYQGDAAAARITFQSYCSDELRLYYIGIQFDWMSPVEFYGLDLSDDPVSISSYGSYTFDIKTIRIPSNVSAGSHNYFVGVEGLQVGQAMVDFSWDSPISVIEIHDVNEKVFYALRSEVADKINAAINANYKNPEAQSLLNQAKNEYSTAHLLGNEDKWQEAVASLQKAADYVEQAEAKEQTGGGLAGIPQSLVLILAVSVIVVIVVAIIAVIVKKKRKQTNSVVDQSLETIEEQG